MHSSTASKHRVFFVVALVALAGCGDTMKGKSLAEPEVTAFHERLNAKRYEEIYSLAGEDFRKAVPKEKVLDLFGAIDRKLGAVKSSSTVNWNVRTHNFVTAAVLIADTQFEKGKATETFTFRVDKGKAELVGYHINSMDMMIN